MYRDFLIDDDDPRSGCREPGRVTERSAS